jgi:cytochrome c-type biogenesis protein CcmF
MENLLLVAATVLCGGCASITFFGKKPARTALVLWCAVGGLVLCAAGLLVFYLLNGNFEYAYVYNHTSIGLPPVYRVSALWSGQEGSLLLWAAVLAGTGFFLLKDLKKRPRVFGAYTALCLLVLVMCCLSQPFARLDPVPPDGLGLARALQDPWMVAHPPLVFVAYSMMAVLFAKGTAFSKDENACTAHRVNGWCRMSWVFLGLGIMTGSVWAYHALGWGGFWAWDPIENAALVPWLILGGLLHRKNRWSRTRCMLPFAAAGFGVFLTRSGVLGEGSAHAYAEGNTIITVLLLVMLFGAVLYFAVVSLRKAKRAAGEVGGEKPPAYKIFMDKKRLLAWNVNVYAGLILVGTVAPLLMGSETPKAYYAVISAVFALAFAAILLVWHEAALKKHFIGMMALGTALTVGVIAVTGASFSLWVLVIWACLLPPSLWIVNRFKTENSRFYLLHTGLCLLIAGAVASSALSKEGIAAAAPGAKHIALAGIEVPLADIAASDVLIVTLPHADFVVRATKAFSLADGTVLVPFTEKPLVLLFWGGGAMMLAAPFFGGWRYRFRWRQKGPKDGAGAL